MALSSEQRRILLARTLPQDAEVRARLLEYMQRAQIQTLDMAKRIGYASSSLKHFIHGTYEAVAGDSRSIRAKLIDFMEAHPLTVETEAAGRLYETESVRRIREYFYEALDNRRAYWFRGAPGTQKSFTLKHLIAELNRNDLAKNGHGRRAFYVYCRHGIRPHSLMKRVATAASSITTGDIDRIFRNLKFDIGRRKVLFVFDEAQHLDIACLETLRELIDEPPHCGLLFAGSHELETTFQRLDMEQWRRRLRQGTEVIGLNENEAAEIIHAELGPQPEAKVRGLIKKCYSPDLRKGRDVTYLSAGMLFGSISAIQEKAKGKGATA